MKYKDEDFGVKIIETITAGLYDGNLNCIREYVQNSIDSGAKNITIGFENGRDLIIKDDGNGMSENELERSLSLGISDKKDEDVGWRGIGIWSGVSSCKRIVIITKKKNHDKNRIDIKNDLLRKELESNKKAVDVLSYITGDPEKLELGKSESFEDSHFTEVRLESILPTQDIFFNDKEIPIYLERNVPAQFDKSKFKYADKINNELRKHDIKIPEINIEYIDKHKKRIKIFRPPFKSEIFFDDIIYKEFKINNDTIAFGWLIPTNKNSALKSPNKGIFFKKKGFTLGDENLIINRHDGSYNPWQYGEIHIISKKLKENAPRNNFEYNNDYVDPFLKDVGKYVGQLQMMNRYQSSKIINRRIEKIKTFFEKGEINNAKKELKKAKESLNRKISFPKDKSLLIMKNTIDEESNNNKSELKKIEDKVTKTKTKTLDDEEKQKQIISNLPKPIQDQFIKNKKHWLEPETNIMKPIIDILKEKAELDMNDIPMLSKEAFGWISGKDNGKSFIKQSNKKPKLTISKGCKSWRDICFGVWICAVHEIFINPTKHEKGHKSFEWFENLSNDEKKDVMLGVYSTIGLIYRIIEKSEFRQP